MSSLSVVKKKIVICSEFFIEPTSNFQLLHCRFLVMQLVNYTCWQSTFSFLGFLHFSHSLVEANGSLVICHRNGIFHEHNKFSLPTLGAVQGGGNVMVFHKCGFI